MKTLKLSVLGLLVLSYCQALSADNSDPAQNLDAINVNAESSQNILEKKVGETQKTAQQLNKQQVQDSRDLVRYETGITVVENGRFGSSGYSIRGVDENRVAVVIDGLHQAETLSSQGFKELFEGYGNFNNTRNSAEIETLKQVSIRKGGDSVKVGSGALGGAVIFETKDARDFLTEKDYHLGYKTGYSTRDNQSLHSLTLAGRYKWFDALFIKTRRNGHELENYDYKSAADIQGRYREKADPYHIVKDSTLLKLSFSPNENHRLTLAADLYENKTKGNDFSYTLKYSKTGFNDNREEEELRHTNDKSKRHNLSITYENYSSNLFWDSLKLSYSDQKIKNRARTDEYCEGERCAGIQNPLGLQIKDGKIADKEGNPINLQRVGDKNEVVDSTGKPFPYPGDEKYYTLKAANQYWFDCSLYDCSKPIDIYSSDDWGETYNKSSADLSKKWTDPNTGKQYAQADVSFGKYIILPKDKGYLERLWQERDLDTHSKQLNLDLTKAFNTFSLEHYLEYGASYNQTKKQMVNRAGYDATNVQWWADKTLGLDFFDKPYTCATAYSWNASLCPKTDPEFSFLLPVKSKTTALYFADNVKLNQYVSFDLGYRYDHINYKPEYTAGVTPKLPDDLVKGLYVPIPKGAPCSWCSSGYYDPSEEQLRQNAIDNINYIAQKKKFKAHSYAFSATIDPTNFFRMQLKYAKGFRVATPDEIYFTFKHPDFTILPNLNLQPETSKSGEIAFTLHNDWGFVSTSLFKTKYHNFIDLVYLGRRDYKIASGGSSLPFSLYQNKNRENATVNGFEINAKLNLDALTSKLAGFNLSYKYTYQKGRIDGGIPMNAIQPKTAIYGIGYQHPEDKFGLDIYVSHVGSKKPEDTYNMYYKEQGLKDSSLKWRSDSYTLVDLVGYVKPIKNLSLQLGVYNLTNRKYLTWESARSIKPFGTSNRIDNETGAGINRFYAPGRNFKLNAEFTF